MSLSCPKLIRDIKLIKNLRAELSEQEEEFLLFKNTKEADRSAKIERLSIFFKLRQILILQIQEMKDDINEYIFIVEEAVNPYAEALKEGGIINAAEIIDININLQEILDQDYRAYIGAGCDIWAEALPKDIKELNLAKEQLELIKARVKLGEIPIVMPGRLAQIMGLMQAIENLKPMFIVDGKEQKAADTYHWGYIDSLIIVMKKIAELQVGGNKLSENEISEIKKELDPLVKDKANATQQLIDAVASLPEKPYIFTASTSQQNDIRTRNKDLARQIAELAKIQEETPGVAAYCMFISEYLALENRFTERVRKQADTKLDSLLSLDDSNRTNYTFSKFINLPVSLGGGVPYGYWSSDGSRVAWSRGRGSASSSSGFRISVRV